MKKIIFSMMLTISSFSVFANTQIEMRTNMGNIQMELFDKQAPVSTKNFTAYIKEGFYKGTIFHRVIPGFMIQGGGLDINMHQKKTKDPIVNESSNGLKNQRGTLAMARTQAVNSATSQFFINVADNAFLDRNSSQAGYAVFGKVISGMDVVDRIVQIPRQTKGAYTDVPEQAVEILEIKITGK